MSRIIVLLMVGMLSGCATDSDILHIQGQIDTLESQTKLVSKQSKNVIINSTDVIEKSMIVEEISFETEQLMGLISEKIDKIVRTKGK